MTDRYQRHSLIDWFDQRKLQDARVIVVGAGAVGNEVLKNLVLLGVGHIHVFDFDKIEEHNLTRCVLFRDSDIGRDKAEAAVEACRQIDPTVEIHSTCADFWDGLSLGEIAEADSVVCCVDNYEARIRLNRLCLMMATDFYDAGIDSQYVAVEVFPFSTSPDCACYECTLPPSAYHAIQQRYSCGWLRKVAFEEKKIPTTAITSSMAGAVVVSLLLHRLNDHPRAIQYAARLFQDTITLAATLSTIQRDKNCFACGSVDQTALHLVARRLCGIESVIPLVEAGKGEIVLSEPVLTSGVCTLCGRRQEYYESARRLTDAVIFCSECRTQSVSLEIVERLSVDDFRRLFAGRNLPCKFLTYRTANRQTIIELEE
jgi:molybdopterin-synthase adenylyltransferase